MWYTVEGQESSQRLWEETVRELEPFGAAEIMEGMKASLSRPINK